MRIGTLDTLQTCDQDSHPRHGDRRRDTDRQWTPGALNGTETSHKHRQRRRSTVTGTEVPIGREVHRGRTDRQVDPDPE